ncbi:hypothetical protein RD792_017388 [Penstemon davidsonii]|uniref:Pentatricopeptide repeat-containing protein n=1 Tax=Penstemon davidsonii TaxID=160366 RepID=A0ABR0CLV1_9LAMI|nr:hypothetical protein RD792_017388 [Penstemon davidsonii]
MLSKAKNLYSLSQLQTRLCLNNYCNNYINGVRTQLHSAFCTAVEPLKAEDSSGITESPELPDWVKFSDKNEGVSKPDDDDFVPPSILYWIENRKIQDQDHSDMKTIVNDIVQSDIDKISKILKNQFTSPELVVKALDGCDVDISESLIEQVLKRFSCEWIPSFGFFKWAELQNGITHSPDLYNLMVDNLGKTKKFDVMWELVEEMNKLEGYVTLDTMTKIMRRLSKAGKYDEAIKAFNKIEQFGIEKDVTSMNRLMDALVKQGSVEHAEKVFLEFKEHIPPSSQTYNILIHGWCKARKIDKANKTIEEMKIHGFSPDSVTYTCFVEAYCRDKDFRKVYSTLEEMRKNGFHPSVITYTITMKALARAKETDKAIEVYETMKRENCSIDASFCSSFIYTLNKAGRLKDSDAVFEDMSKQGIWPDVVTYNTLITLAAHNLQEEKALKLLLRMEENKCKPDLNTYCPLLKMCCRLKRMKVLSFLLSHMFKNDVSIDLGTYCLLITGLCKNGKLERACLFFEESLMKGFVPMDCTYKNLVNDLEKKGMSKEKQRIEELMLNAKQHVTVDSSKKMEI